MPVGTRPYRTDRRPARAALLLATVLGVTLSPGAVTSAQAHSPSGTCRPAVIDLGVPTGAVGGEVLDHNENTYVGSVAYADGTQRPALWRRTGEDSFDVARTLRLPPGMVAGFVGDINHRDQAVVAYFSASGEERGFIDAAGRLLPLRDFAGTSHTYVRRINDDGTAAGEAFDATGGAHAALWRIGDPSPHRLAELPGDDGSFALGINNAGDTVGGSYNASHVQAVLWPAGGAPVRLPAPGPDSQAYAINDSGRIVGIAANREDTAFHAAVWDAGRPPVNLGIFPGDEESFAYGVSPDGRVVGASNTFDRSSLRALYWPGHGPTLALTPLGGDRRRDAAIAHGVDDQDNVLGASSRTPGGEPQPTLWTCAQRQAFSPDAEPGPAASPTPAQAAQRSAAGPAPRPYPGARWRRDAALSAR